MLIDFGNSVTNCSIIFDLNGNYGINNDQFSIRGNNWNGGVHFPNGVIYPALRNSRYMNRVTMIPNSVTSLGYSFADCYKFNQNIQIPNSVTNMSSAFRDCNALNQNIQIPNSVTNMSNIFYACTKLNQNIQIPNSVTDIANIFRQGWSLNQNIQIPNSVRNAWFAFRDCNNMIDLSISDGIKNNVFVGILSINNIHSRNIWTTPSSAANLITTNIIHSTNSNTKIEAQIRPTWETIDNGYYNSYYNVYIYTNAVFA